MSDESVDDERTVVKTYVPRYQKERWQEHAASLDMSQSEFVRAMVQAGRNGFDLDHEEPASPDVTPGVDGLKEGVLATLATDTYLSWEELVTELTDDIEDRLESTLKELQGENRVQYSGRHGGYVLVGGDDE